MFTPLRIFQALKLRSNKIWWWQCSPFATKSALQSKDSPNVSKSTLYFSSKGDVFTVLQPSFDVPYLQSVARDLESIQKTMSRRGLETDYPVDEMKSDINRFANLSEQLNKLKKKRVKLQQKIRKKGPSEGGQSELDNKYAVITNEWKAIRQSFYEVESKVIPLLLNIPAQIREDMGDTPQIIDQFAGSASAVATSGAISYVRLGYINNIFLSSIVGPDAQFLLGDGALAFYAIIDYIGDLFEAADYVSVNGVDIVRSALVEAVNNKNVHHDLFKIRDSHQEEGEDEEKQRLHLTGDASIESLCAWLTKLADQPVGSKFIQVGSSYGNSLSQTHSVRASSLSDQALSDHSMEGLYSLWWKVLTGLGLKCRSLRVDAASLALGEHAKYQLSVWLPSKGEYLPVGEVTHYGPYLTVRIGRRDCKQHLLSSSVDLLQLLKCLLEHYQDPSTGKVKYPPSLTNYFL